jgi:flagellar motor switch protein FliG
MKADKDMVNAPMKTPDEEVDGPGIAASILTRMSEPHRKQLMHAIRARSSAAADRIEKNLFSFEDVGDLTPQGIQLLIKNIDNRDLVTSLKKASQHVRDTILSNMTDRRRQIVEEDMAALGNMRNEEVQNAQQRILIKLDELRKSGAVRTNNDKDIWV